MDPLIYALAGLLVTFGTSLLKNAKWSTQSKQAVAAALSTVAGVVTAYFELNGTVELGNSIRNSAMLVGIAQLIYVFAVKDTAINNYLEKLNVFSWGVKKEVTKEEAIVSVVTEVKKEVKSRSTATAKKPATKKTTTPKTTLPKKTVQK